MAKKRIPAAGIVQVGRIEERAYAIWESEGKPHGREVEHWLRAEAEAALATNASHPAKPRLRSVAHAKKPAKIIARKK